MTYSVRRLWEDEQLPLVEKTLARWRKLRRLMSSDSTVSLTVDELDAFTALYEQYVAVRDYGSAALVNAIGRAPEKP